MRSARCLSAILLTGLFLCPEPGVAKVVGLKAVTDSAIRCAIPLAQAAQKIAIQNTEIQGAWADIFPKVDAQYRLNAMDYTTNGRDALAKIQLGRDEVAVYPIQPSKFTGNLDLTVTQLLYSGGRVMADINKQYLQLEQEKINFAQCEDQVLAEAMEKYWNYELANCKYQDALLNLADLVTITQSEKLKKAQGLTAHIQDIEAELELVNAQEDVKKAGVRRVTARSDLERATHMDLSKDQMQIPVQSFTDLSRLWQQLKRPDPVDDLEVNKQKLGIDISQKNQIIANSRFLPELRLQGGMNYFNTDYDRLNRAAWNLKYGSAYAALVLQWNLFNGFKDKAESEKAAEILELAKLGHQETQQKNEALRQNLAQDVNLALSELKRSEKNLEWANQRMNDQKLLKAMGKLSQHECLRTQISFRKSSAARFQTSIDARLAILNWCRVTHRVKAYLALENTP